MIPRTRLVIIVILIAAILIVGGVAFIWFSLTRPGTPPPGPNPAVTLSPVQTGLDWPVALAFASDGRVFYAERNTGAIRIIENGSVLPTPFFTLSNTATAGERGLLGLALDPGFPANPWVYAYQTYNDAANASTYNRIVRIQASGDTGGSLSVILQMPPLSSATNHNGGVIAFGPDGKLWAVVGENADPNLSQDHMSLLGKVLRMNSDGSAAAGNPFYGSLSWENRVYTYGHRNMFGLTWHPVTGRAYVTENGPNCNDEVNFLTAGSNYGWGPSATCPSPPSPQSTNQDGPSPVMPIAWWTPTIAPTNAAFFTGSLLPESRNDLFFGAYNDHRLRELKLTSSGTAVVNNTVLLTAPDAILDVEMGRDGFLWVTTPTTIYRLVAAPTIMSTGAMSMIAGLFAVALPTREIADARRGRTASLGTAGRSPSRKP
ncbi:MAG: PQQ-dependent sugar dehydrogenase [Methanobacteriota archaeon]|nr:MAG: PQQ-dependent sugar dehydrogenase [Euryarchaeota archaeon]